jgi:hypothetical protein
VVTFKEILATEISLRRYIAGGAGEASTTVVKKHALDPIKELGVKHVEEGLRESVGS